MPLKPVTKHRLRRPIRVRRVRVRLLDLDDEEERSVALELLAQHHYLGAPSLIGRHILYAVEIGEYCLGLVCFSDACRALSARDRFLGWGAIERERRLGFLVQNDRFLLIPDVPIGNLAARALGLCTRRLAGDWEKSFGVPILGVETFVDPSRFCGTCYQAANWQRIGETQGYGQDGSGYTYHGQPKTVWLYPLDTSSWDVLRGRSLPPRLRPFGRKPTENTVRSTASPSRLQTLRAAMQRIPDRRSKRGRTHRISTCLSIIMLGLAAGAETISGCLAFAKTLDKRQLQALGVYRHPRSRKLCLPSYSSICRILAEIDPLAAEEALSGWQQQCDTCPLALAIDGKTLRGSLGHAEEEGHVVVTAYAHDPQSPFFAQTMLDSKGYEREGACRLLARLGDLSGTTVTLDALHACHPICDQAALQNANLIITVKDNASALRDELVRQFEQAGHTPGASTYDNLHGRRERRVIEVIPIDGQALKWPHLRWALRITRRRREVRAGKTTKRSKEAVYAVATHSRADPPTPQQFLGWVRGHWAIENRLHHRKDRTLMEDRSRLKKSSARIMAAMRTFVTSVIGALGGYMPNQHIRLAGDRKLLLAILGANSLQEWVLQSVR